VAEVMNPGPSTYRPSTSVHEMAHVMQDSGAQRVLVSDGDGHLIGIVRREAVAAHLHGDGPVLASTSDIGGTQHE